VLNYPIKKIKGRNPIEKKNQKTIVSLIKNIKETKLYEINYIYNIFVSHIAVFI